MSITQTLINVKCKKARLSRVGASKSGGMEVGTLYLETSLFAFMHRRESAHVLASVV